MKSLNAPSAVKTIGPKVIVQCLTADGALNVTSKCCTHKRNSISDEVVARSCTIERQIDTWKDLTGTSQNP